LFKIEIRFPVLVICGVWANEKFKSPAPAVRRHTTNLMLQIMAVFLEIKIEPAPESLLLRE
jgi:hypothetical protein